MRHREQLDGRREEVPQRYFDDSQRWWDGKQDGFGTRIWRKLMISENISAGTYVVAGKGGPVGAERGASTTAVGVDGTDDEV